MPFEEDLIAVIEKAGSEREKEERAIENFDNDWARKRGEILEIFRRAVNVFQDSKHINGGSAEMKNGNAVILRADDPDKTLEFKPNKPLQILCESTVEALSEPFDLDALTHKAVERKIKDFAHAIARGENRRV
jgi:hypothetical protein